uniref:hypothetical protein n=1 Tax=Faecalibacterium sp. TaxID=1971605 RepID=UPI004025CEB7
MQFCCIFNFAISDFKAFFVCRKWMDGPLCANGRKKTDGCPFPAAVRSESLQFPALLAGEEAQGGGGAEHLAGPQHRG